MEIEWVECDGIVVGDLFGCCKCKVVGVVFYKCFKCVFWVECGVLKNVLCVVGYGFFVIECGCCCLCLGYW